MLPPNRDAAMVGARSRGVELLEQRVVLTPPVAFADSYTVVDDHFETVAENKPSVLANDYDADGDPLTAELVSGPANRSLTLDANGHFFYVSALGFVGTDSFVYRAFGGGE